MFHSIVTKADEHAKCIVLIFRTFRVQKKTYDVFVNKLPLWGKAYRYDIIRNVSFAYMYAYEMLVFFFDSPSLLTLPLGPKKLFS